MNSTSASPDEALLGIDPDDTKEVKFGAGTFTVGVLPAGLWDVIHTQYWNAVLSNRRRSIASLHREGLDPESPDPEAGGATYLEARCAADVEFIKETFRIQLDALRMGLKGHTGLRSKRGPVEFKTEAVTLEGETRQVVAKETLRFYEANKPLVKAIYAGIRELNTLSDAGKKA